MATFTFGNFPVRMRADDIYIGAIYTFFPSEDVDILAMSASQIDFQDPSTGATGSLFGVFDYSSEPAFLASTFTGMVMRTPGGALIGQGTGFSILVADMLAIEDDPTLMVSLLSGADRVTSGSGNDLLNGFGGADTLLGGLGADTLYGGLDGDRLEGGGGNDMLFGGTGNDTLIGGIGSDRAEGAGGNDTYVVDSAGDVVVEAAGSGVDRVQSSIGFSFAIAGRAELENLTLTGTGAINGTGNAKANVLTGNGAANRLDGVDGNDTVAGAAGNDTLVGGLGADSLVGGDGKDLIYGGDGNDILNGGAGADTLAGGTGNDTYVLDNAGDVVVEPAAGGTDLVTSSIGFSFAVAGRAELENLTLTGTGAINGTGNAKPNLLTGNGAANRLDGGDGNDTVVGAPGNDTLVGGTGADSLVGGDGWDLIYGGDGNDTLNGGAGADTLAGGIGNDVLYGSTGADTLTGGLGTDRFKFVLATEGLDTLSDFSAVQGDKLEFVSPNFGALPVGTLAPTRFFANTTGLPGDPDDRFIFETDTRVLWYDGDGTVATIARVAIAKLNTTTLANTDILIAAS